MPEDTTAPARGEKRDRFGNQIVRYARIPIDDVTADALDSLRDADGRCPATQKEGEFLKWVLREAVCCVADWREDTGSRRIPYRPTFHMRWEERNGKFYSAHERWLVRNERLAAIDAVLAKAGVATP